MKVQDRIAEPKQLKEVILVSEISVDKFCLQIAYRFTSLFCFFQQLLSEMPLISEKLEKASQNGQIIIANSKNDAEKQLISKTIESLRQELSEAGLLIEDRKVQVTYSLGKTLIDPYYFRDSFF